jgi:hypothetical protein
MYVNERERHSNHPLLTSAVSDCNSSSLNFPALVKRIDGLS